MARTIAIGDIHGCSMALRAIVEAIRPLRNDVIIPLGDYVDRGIDSKGVLDQLIELQSRCTFIPILGNHDQMMLSAFANRFNLQFWLNCGGDSTLDSYGPDGGLDSIPQGHKEFLRTCRSYHETDTHIFTHANCDPDVALDEQDDRTLRWLSLRDSVPARRHRSGKMLIVGHTQFDEVQYLEHVICIDTAAYNGGWLTAMDVDSGELWQANEFGILRSN